MDISNARNSVVVNHVRLKFYTSIFGAIIKSLLAKKGIFSMMNFRHSSTLSPVSIMLIYILSEETPAMYFNALMKKTRPKFQTQ